MWNDLFQKAWFGPFVIPDAYPVLEVEERSPGYAYDDGFGGPLEASLHAQWFGRPSGLSGSDLGQKPVFCRPGFTPVPTGVPGQSKCVFFSPPSTMLTGAGPETVSKMTPPSWPTARTFPVKPFYGFQIG
jgi:hypothetical protein